MSAFDSLTKAQIEEAISKITAGAQSYQTPAGTVTRANLATLMRLHQDLEERRPRSLVMRTVVVG